MQKFLSVNSNLGQERHGYTCAEVSVTHFLMPKVLCKTIAGFRSYLKKPPGGGIHPPPPTLSPPKKKFAKV